MVKKRDIKNADIEKFAAGADGDNELDPNAKRDYKKIMFAMNEYENKALEELATITSRSKTGAIRWAVLTMLEMEKQK